MTHVPFIHGGRDPSPQESVSQGGWAFSPQLNISRDSNRLTSGMILSSLKWSFKINRHSIRVFFLSPGLRACFSIVHEEQSWPSLKSKLKCIVLQFKILQWLLIVLLIKSMLITGSFKP